MSKVKVGDVVRRCARYRTLDWAEFCMGLRVAYGDPLTVTAVLDGGVILDGCNGHLWDPCHFEVVSTSSIQESVPKAPEAVNSPKHYAGGGVECIDAIKASMSSEAFKGYLKGNIQKYLWRYEKKVASLEDLHKARVHLEWLIEANKS